ncbi:MAG TPA: hypothetical protein VEP49_03480 [Acidimicrobiia bacterium]|nr:hypothetical protein [Acidimicrobiia bacterium]
MTATKRLVSGRGGVRALVVGAVVGALVAGGVELAGMAGGAGSAGSSRGGAAATTTTPLTTTAAPTTTTVPIGEHDGSLGDADSRLACTLLTPAEIEAQFGGPVGDATPLYPYCQWLVGDDAFIAVQIFRQPIDQVRNFQPVRFNTSGIGDDGGYIATTRAIFFGKNGVSYSIMWQKVGDFTTVETDRLSALAQDVLAKV